MSVQDRIFYDRESERVITEQALRAEYSEYKHDIELSSGAKTFGQALHHYLTDGSLQEITPKRENKK